MLYEVITSRGLAAVEFTILLPLLLLLLLAIAEFGRAFYQYAELEKITRNTARYVAERAHVDSSTAIDLTASVTTPARNLAVTGNVNGINTGTTGEAVLSLLPGLKASDVTFTEVGGDSVMVTISYQFQPMLFGSTLKLPTFGQGDDIDLNFQLVSSVVMRVL